jgi:hypothetical protein
VVAGEKGSRFGLTAAGLMNQIQWRPPARRVEVKDEDGKRRPLFYALKALRKLA